MGWIPEPGQGGGGGGGNAAYAETVGDGNTTSFDITHGLGSSDVAVEVIELSSGDALVHGTDYTWLILDEDEIRVVFSSAPGVDDARVVVLAAGGEGGGGGAGRTLLGQVTLESPQSAIEFTDLNQGFSDLLIVCRLRSDRASNTGDDVELVLGDESYDTGGSSYRYREIGDGSATTTDGAASIRMNRIAAANADPGVFGLLRITIFDYSLAGERLIETKGGGYWTSGTSTGTGTSSATAVRQGIGVWRNTSVPVSRLRLTPGNGSNFVAGSSVRVYGLS